MNFSAIKDVVTSKTARQVFLAQKHSPKILFVAGTVGVIGATVLACRATLKITDVLEDHEKHVDYIKEDAGTEQISHEEATKQIHKAQIRTAAQIAKPYLPAVGLGLVSIAALTGSHVILTKRNTTVMAAYAGLDRAYKAYRQNVVDKYGKDEDYKIAANVQRVNVEEKTADGKTKITATDVINKKTGHLGSPYAVIFDEVSGKFSKEPGRNALTVSIIQSWANDRLRANKHLFLNDALDMLQLPRTPQGQIVGWLYRPNDDTYAGDGYVDFGVFEGDQERAEAFIDGVENCVWLDFNVDGPIWDKI